MKNLGVLHGIKWVMYHGLLDFMSKPTSKRCGSNTKPRDYATSKTLQPSISCTILIDKLVVRQGSYEYDDNDIESGQDRGCVCLYIARKSCDTKKNKKSHFHGIMAFIWASGALTNFMVTSLGHSAKWPFSEHIKRYAVPLCALPTPHTIWNSIHGFNNWESHRFHFNVEVEMQKLQ